jgi:erythromycin esterase
MQSLARSYRPETLHEWLPSFATGAKIIGIGESTHGTDEFFRTQADITRFLIERGDVRLVLLELPSLYGLYAQHLMAQDSRSVLEFIHNTSFVTWHNTAIAGLITFIDDWNRAHPHDPVQFVGFDPRKDGCLEALINYVDGRGEPLPGVRSWATQASLALQQLAALSAEASGSDCRGHVPVARLARSGLLLKIIDDLCLQATSWEGRLGHDLFAAQALLFSAKHLEFMARSFQAGKIRASEARDKIMAEIILKETSRLKGLHGAVVLAHSAHVAYGPPGVFSYGMGHHIRQGIGESKYRVIVTATGEGSVRTLADATAPRRELFVADASPEGSLERLLHDPNDNHPRLFDLRSARNDPAKMRYLSAPIGFRSTGSLVYRNEFTILKPAEQFDGIVFFPRSRGAL